MSKKNYQAMQKRKDDEHFFQESLRNRETPWITITHDGRELLQSVLRGLLKEEFSKDLDPPIVIKMDAPQQVPADDQEIIKALREYVPYVKPVFWTIEKDKDLMVFVMNQVIAGSTRESALRLYSEVHNLTEQKVKMRWKVLKQARSKIKFVRWDTL